MSEWIYYLLLDVVSEQTSSLTSGTTVYDHNLLIIIFVQYTLCDMVTSDLTK